MADALRGGIVINEIHAQPVGGGGFDTDGNGTVSALDEYLEFYNTSAQPIDLSGLQLWDPGSGNWFTFPAGSVIGPGGYALVVTGVQAGGSLPPVGPGSLAFNAGRSTAVLNNPGDNVYLVDPVAGEFISAAYGNWPLMDPTDPTTWGVRPSGASVAGLTNFPAVTQVGAGEDFGPLVPGSAIQRVPDGGNTFYNNSPPQTGDFQGTPGFQNVCFVAGTRIAVPRGWRAVEALRPGHRVVLADGQRARVKWVGMRRLSFAELEANPKLWPIEIAPGALGPGVPARCLRLSPQHRVQVEGRIVDRIAGAPHALIAARHLLGLPGITQPRPTGPVTYLHLMCEGHRVILAEGARCETLYLGAMARNALPAQALEEIFTLFPDLAQDEAPMAAHPILPGPKARTLVARHLAHARPLQAAAASARG